MTFHPVYFKLRNANNEKMEVRGFPGGGIGRGKHTFLVVVDVRVLHRVYTAHRSVPPPAVTKGDVRLYTSVGGGAGEGGTESHLVGKRVTVRGS